VLSSGSGVAKLRREAQAPTRKLASQGTTLDILPFPPSTLRPPTHGHFYDSPLDALAVYILDCLGSVRPERIQK